MNSLNKQFFQTIKVVVLGLIVGLGTNYVFAYDWSPPTQAPTGGNTAAPLNVSGTVQEKTGGLIIGSGLTSGATGLYITHGNLIVADTASKIGIGTLNPTQKLDVATGYVRGGTGLCIADDCRTAWPTGTGGGGINGSGTANYVAKFTNSTTIGNSSIFDTGANVGINTNTPSRKLDVNGSVRIRGGTPADGYVLTAQNSNGDADWKPKLTKSGEKTCVATENQSQVCDTGLPKSEWTACFLTSYTLYSSGDTNPAKCEVDDATGSNWVIKAQATANDSVTCKAVCIK